MMVQLPTQAVRQKPMSMLTSRSISFFKITLTATCLLFAASFASQKAFAFDGAPVGSGILQPVNPALSSASSPSKHKKYKNGTDALRQGIMDYQAGEKLKATVALEYAADEGNVAARWKLGRMYADGDGVGIDDYKAYQYFMKVADENSDISPDSRLAPAVAKAFVALGTYYRDGIKNTAVRPNTKRAQELFHYAAAYFADPDGQYHLGRLYLDGTSGEKDSLRAAQWLNLSAEKGHVYAMAVLGNLLVNGDAFVPAQIPKGLMWLDLAKEKANSKRDMWVFILNETAYLKANDEHKLLAGKFKKQHASQFVDAKK